MKKNTARGHLPFAVCTVACAPVRKRASDTEEMTNQLLFGECVEVKLKKHNNWMKIRSLWDDYEGWVDAKQFVRISDEERIAYDESPSYTIDLVQSVSNPAHTFPILLGSRLPNFDGLHCYIHDTKYVFNGAILEPKIEGSHSPEYIERIARKFIHAPYLWGGRSMFGIDCSGFTQLVYKLLGYKLPRDASQQVHHGEVVDFLSTAQAGDLAFFNNADGKIVHVGIMLDDRRIIHASGQVRIDILDEQGIYNKALRKYTHTFRVAKRIIELVHTEEN